MRKLLIASAAMALLSSVAIAQTTFVPTERGGNKEGTTGGGPASGYSSIGRNGNDSNAVPPAVAAPRVSAFDPQSVEGQPDAMAGNSRGDNTQ